MIRKQLPKFDQFLFETDYKFLKKHFENDFLIDRNFSQAFQDMFVLTMLNGKRNGYYIEIGSGYPITVNNTFLLEQYFNWSGKAIELDSKKVEQYNNARKNKCYCLDALTIDYNSFLLDCPNHIDYLQIDVCVNDDSSNNLIVLENVLNTNKTFSVITFETNVYQVGTQVQDKGFELLSNAGYTRLIKDVIFQGEIFEDWYIKNGIIEPSLASHFMLDTIDCKNILLNW